MPRPQFTLRALLVAMLVAGALLGWVGRDANIVRERKAMQQVLWGGDFCLRAEGVCGVAYHDKPLLPWLRRFLGDKPIFLLFYVADKDPDGSALRRVRELFPEAEILVE